MPRRSDNANEVEALEMFWQYRLEVRPLTAMVFGVIDLQHDREVEAAQKCGAARR